MNVPGKQHIMVIGLGFTPSIMSFYKHVHMNASSAPETVPLEISVTAKGDTALISITGHISEYSSNNSGQIIKDIKAAKDAGATKAKIYINSGGGSVFEANEILNLIASNFDDDKVAVKVGALAASAATIFVAKYKTTASANTQIMIHKPMMGVGGNEDEIEARLKLLKNLTSQYRTMYADKMGMAEKALEALWKTDYWMTAKEAKEKGFIDDIDGEKEEIDANSRLQLVACGAPIIPVVKSTTPKKNSNLNQKPLMELELLAVSLGLPKTATQAEVDAKINELKAAAAEVATLKAAAETKAKADKATKIKAILDQAEKDKKIDPTMRGNYEQIGENNLEQLEAILKTTPAVQAASAQITPSASGASASGEDRSKWTFQDYQDKDPEAFVKMATEDEAKAKALADAHYKEN